MAAPVPQVEAPPDPTNEIGRGGANPATDGLPDNTSTNVTTSTAPTHNAYLFELADRRREAGSWRDVLKIHPAADMFPLLDINELQDLASDIFKYGLAEKIVYTGTASKFVVLDGRNRLDALALCGWRAIDEDGHPRPEYCEHHADIPDITAWIISKNIRRRHLNAAQRRDLITKLLMLTPEKSNRAVAQTVGVDHKTVATVRAEAERTGEIPQLEKTTGADGKARPTKKPTTTKPAPTLTTKPAPFATGTAPAAPSSPAAAPVHTADPDEVQAILDQIETNLAPADLLIVVAAGLERIAMKKSDILNQYGDDKVRDKYRRIVKELRARSKGRKP